LRHKLDAVEKRFPKMKPMVLIGYSMGGCISRLLLSDSGNKLWMNIFGRPPDEVPLSPHVREYFRQEFSFGTGQKLDPLSLSPLPLARQQPGQGTDRRLAAMIIREPTVSSQVSREVLCSDADREG
jgi:hypothetical protein